MQSKKKQSFRKFIRTLGVALGIASVVIPPGLVVYHNWCVHREFADIYYAEWHAVSYLKNLSLPTYFLIILPLFILSIMIFFGLGRNTEVRLPDQITGSLKKDRGSIEIPRWQKRTSTGLFLSANICLLLFTTFSIIQQSVLGIEVLGIVLLYLLGLVLKESDLRNVKPFLVKHAGWILAYSALYLSVLLILQMLFGEKNHQPEAGTILIFILVLVMLRWYRKIPMILWVCLGALILYAWGIDSWIYSVIGDEHDFYRQAAYILTNPWSQVREKFFYTIGVFGTHTYLVTLVQAGFMKLFGVSNFGWRISNPVILSAALACFYLFFKRFTGRRVALVICGLLACSSYLMTFGKIGYDNLQAFFMLGVTLWLAAEAVIIKRPSVYAALGLALGFCLYSYPAALYILPLPFLLTVLYDFPKSKSAVWRWAWCIGIISIMATPLLFQPAFGQGKLEGLFISNPDAIAHYGVGFMFTSGIIYSLFSYLYIINESHFVTSSHMDPISAIWIPIGMTWLAVQLKRNKFVVFWSISFFVMLFLAGASHGRQFPPNTRMFMLLPWWASFVAFGITWFIEWLIRKRGSPLTGKVLLSALMGLILLTNLAQVYWVFPRRYAGSQSLEILYLRLVKSIERHPPDLQPIYLFVTDDSWGIDGMHVLQDVYHLPNSDSQLARLVMTGEHIERKGLIQLQAADTIVITQPWLNVEWQTALNSVLVEAGKNPCYIRTTYGTPVKFTAYFPSDMANICPINGNWNK